MYYISRRKDGVYYISRRKDGVYYIRISEVHEMIDRCVTVSQLAE